MTSGRLFLIFGIAALVLAPSAVDAAGYGDACKAGKICRGSMSGVEGFDVCAVSNGATSVMSRVGSCATSNYATCEESCNSTMYGYLNMTVNGQPVVSSVSELNYVCIQAVTTAKLDALCAQSPSPSPAASAASPAGVASLLAAASAAALALLV